MATTDGSGRRDLPTFEQLTPFDEEYRKDPHPRLRNLRETCPVHRQTEFDRVVITSEELIRETVRDHGLGVDPRNSVPGDPVRQFLPEDAEQELSMLFLDDPDHHRLRKLVAAAFAPRAVEKWRATTRRVAETLVEQIQPDEHGDFDLVSALAGPLPAIVIAKLLGIDDKDQEDFKRWSEVGAVAFFNPVPSEEQIRAAEEAHVGLNDVFDREIASRRDNPTDDLIGTMVHAQEDGDRLTEAEIHTMCTLLLIAGNVTTSDLIGNGMRAMLNTPGQLEKLRRDPGKLPAAVEEMLRFDPPVTVTGRITPQDMELAGETIRAGQSMTMILSAANRDPALNPDPDRFDVDRSDIQHHSFGGGAHFCLGAHLARLEAQEAIRALLARFQNLHASPRSESWKQVMGFRGLSEYWIRAT